MGFLNVRRHARGDVEQNVTQFCHGAAALAGQADRGHAHLARHMQSRDDVLRVAARRDADEDAALAAMRLDLAGEDGLIVVIVGPGGQHRGVDRKSVV